MKSVGELSKVSSQIVLKCLYLARIGRPDILCTVNKLARSITKWTEACDKRLNRLISYIHHTCEYKQYCYVGNTAKQCRLGLFQDSDFARDLEDSKSTSGGTLCVFGSHWMCKKQTSVSHSSTESEIISLDAGLSLAGIPALDLWDLIVLVLGNTIQTPERPGRPVVNDKEQRSQGMTNVLNHIDCVPPKSKSRTQKDSGEERVTAKSKPMMNLVSRCSERTPDVLPSTASESPGKPRHESQFPVSSRTEQHHRTGRPVVDAHSPSYSEWNVDKT